MENEVEKMSVKIKQTRKTQKKMRKNGDKIREKKIVDRAYSKTGLLYLPVQTSFFSSLFTGAQCFIELCPLPENSI